MRSTHIRLTMVMIAICGMLGGLTLGWAVRTDAAPWLAPAASDTVSVDWVKEIESELRSSGYTRLFINGTTPQPAVLHLLNSAAQAMEQNKQGDAGI